MKVTTLRKLEPTAVSIETKLAVAVRLNRMQAAIGGDLRSPAPAVLPLACKDEVMSMARGMSVQYRELVHAGLRNGNCGLSEEQLRASADRAAVDFESAVYASTVSQMEAVAAAGHMKAAVAGLYGAMVAALLANSNGVDITVHTPHTDGSSTSRKIESRLVVMQ